MSENIKKLLEAASKDEALKAKLINAEEIGEAIAIAKKAGFDITEDEAKEFSTKAKSDALSDEELDNVAGGYSGIYDC